MKTKQSALAAISIFSLVFLAGCNDRLFDNPNDPNAETRAYEILSTLQIGGIVPVDLTFSGEALWVVDTLSRVSALNYNSGALIRELDFPQPVAGIAYDGKELWLSVKNSSQLVQVNIVNGAEIRVLNLLRGNFGCLDFAAGRLYVVDRMSNTVLVVNPETGNIERSIAQPGVAIDGVSQDGTQLWTIDAMQAKFFRLDESGALVNLYQTPSRSAAGLAFAEGMFWCGDQAGKIYKIRFQ
jgi:DNA-binding beta-propeller fold protein YncE